MIGRDLGLIQRSKLTKNSVAILQQDIKNLVSISQIFLSAVYQNELWAPNTCVKKPLKMANDRKNVTVPVFNSMFERSNIAAKLRYN